VKPKTQSTLLAERTRHSREHTDTYGEWPDYVDDVISGIIFLQDPFCPGPEEMWERDPVPYVSDLGLTWWKYTKREIQNGES